MGYEADLVRSYHQVHDRLVHKPEVKPIYSPQPFDHEPINIWIPSLAFIIRLVALHEQVSIVNLVSARRDKRTAEARLMVYYLARTFTTHSFPVIGYHLGGRDHTTVVYGAKRVAAKRLRDFKLDRKLRMYEDILKASPKASQ